MYIKVMHVLTEEDNCVEAKESYMKGVNPFFLKK